ncbi:MAG: polysaccharide biosynthesis/export family protein [Bacteroidota bacterium]
MNNIIRNFQFFFIVTVLAFFMSACSTKEKNILFNPPEQIKTNQAIVEWPINDSLNKRNQQKEYRHTIKIGDRLEIKFLNNYDIGQGATQSATAYANIDANSKTGYLVNYDSTVTLPLIGRINLLGQTRLEAAKSLERAYGNYVINPIIEVNILSLSVTVLGEVVLPGKVLLDDEKTNLIDVLALSGGFKETAKKNKVRIIRGNQVIQVNLRDLSVVNDPRINVHDGDIIYVQPYAIKAFTEPISSLQSSTFIILALSQLAIVTFQIINFTR